ncbi:MAG: sel1 repeat family protein, partial [Alistipes sp.]|nr:sel1 repeat family protein [Alistipes sp.]
AQYRLGLCSLDSKEKAKWYEKAAEQGYVPAMRELGECYERGMGVAKSKKNAIFWYRKGAEKDDSKCKDALERLGAL